MAEVKSIPDELLARVVLQHQVQEFYFREARLLDERRLTEWLDLLAEDIWYYMPIVRNIKFGDWQLEYSDPESEISYFDETKDILEGRVRQINTGVHWAEEPVSRFVHIINNVEIKSDEGAEIEAASTFFVYQNRLADEVNHFVGRRTDILRRDPDTTFKVVKRKIILAQNVLLPKVINTFF